MGGYNFLPTHAQQPPLPNYAQQNLSPTTTTTSKTTNGALRSVSNVIPPPITPSQMLSDNFTFPNAYPMNAFNENVLVRYCNSNGNSGEGCDENDDRKSTVEESDLSSSESIANKGTRKKVNDDGRETEKNRGDSSDIEEEDDGSNDIETNAITTTTIRHPEVFITTSNDDNVFDDNVDNEQRLIDRDDGENYPTSNEGTCLLLSP